MSDFSYSQQYFLGKLKDIKKKALNNDDASKYRQDFILLRKELKYFMSNNKHINKSNYVAIDADIVKYCDNNDIVIRGFFEQLSYFLSALFSSNHKITQLPSIIPKQLEMRSYPLPIAIKYEKENETISDMDKKEFEDKFSHYLDMI